MSQYFLSAGGGGGGGGDVVGPASSTDNAVVRFDGVTGKLIQNGVATETDAGAFLTAGGTSALPAYSFTSAPTYGMYYDTNVLYLVGNNNRRVELNGSAQTATINAVTNITDDCDVDGKMTMSQGQVVQFTASAISLSVVDTQYQILITDTSVARTVTLPAAPTTGQVFKIKDASGAAGTNNITIDVTGGAITIDNATSQLINIDYGYLTVMFDGTEYWIV